MPSDRGRRGRPRSERKTRIPDGGRPRQTVRLDTPDHSLPIPTSGRASAADQRRAGRTGLAERPRARAGRPCRAKPEYGSPPRRHGHPARRGPPGRIGDRRPCRGTPISPTASMSASTSRVSSSTATRSVVTMGGGETVVGRGAGRKPPPPRAPVGLAPLRTAAARAVTRTGRRRGAGVAGCRADQAAGATSSADRRSRRRSRRATWNASRSPRSVGSAPSRWRSR